VYLGVLKILTTPDVAELRIQSGTHTRMPINCGTQVEGRAASRRHLPVDHPVGADLHRRTHPLPDL